MNILKGRLNRREMSRFVGVKSRDVDRGLANLANLGYIEYKKMKGGKFLFILYPEPVTVRGLELGNN